MKDKIKFDIDYWKGAIKGYFQHSPDAFKQGVYTTLCLATGIPLIAAFLNPVAYGTTIPVLISIVSGLGGNLIADKLQQWAANDEIDQNEMISLFKKSVAENIEFRKQFDDILIQLQTIQEAQKSLSDEDKAWFHKTLQEELPKYSSIRNIYMQNGIYAEYLIVNVYHLSVHPEYSSIIEAYYRSLSEACQQLPLGILDKQFMDNRNGSTIELKDVYTDLDVINILREEDESDHKYGWRLAHAESGDRVPLMDAITRKKSPYIVLLGDAGSGKSTFVNYLTYLLLDKKKELPECLRNYPVIRIILRDATKYLPKDEQCGCAAMLWSTIKDDFISKFGEETGIIAFKEWMNAICQKPCLLLLDGLDEVPESSQRRQCLLSAISDLLSCLVKDSRVIVTARPYAYAQKDWNLMKFQSLALAPFNREQIKTFVASWYTAIQGKGNEWNSSFLLSRQKDLLTAVFDNDRTYLGDLATRPVLLTLMATLHASNGELPEDRAELYENAVDLMIKRWQRQWISNTDLQNADSLDDTIRNALLLGENNLRKGLEKVAYQAHKSSKNKKMLKWSMAMK